MTFAFTLAILHIHELLYVQYIILSFVCSGPDVACEGASISLAPSRGSEAMRRSWLPASLLPLDRGEVRSKALPFSLPIPPLSSLGPAITRDIGMFSFIAAADSPGCVLLTSRGTWVPVATGFSQPVFTRSGLALLGSAVSMP